MYAKIKGGLMVSVLISGKFQNGGNMKRKFFGCFLIVILCSGALFASTYEDGYKDGYSDGKLGIANKYEKPAMPGALEDLSSPWEIIYYVDSFGDKTNEGFVTNKEFIEGTFSNSATRNSELLVYFLIGKDYFNIALLEYGSSRVMGNAKSPTKYSISLKDRNGAIYYTSGENYSDRIRVVSSGVSRIFELLSTGGVLKFNITENDHPTTSYNFAIAESKGFEEALKVLK
jgi:hypothetical protein